MGTPNKVTAGVEAELLRRWRAGETALEIAAALKLNRVTVGTHLRRLLGVETPEWNGAGRIALIRQRRNKPLPVFVPPDNPPRLEIACELVPGEAARFWAKVSAPNERGCRFWLASFSGDAGQFASFVNGKTKNDMAYRVAWRLTYGPLPKGINTNHRCDVRACVEPTHLWAGTQAANLKDMAAKGRARGKAGMAKGETVSTAVLTTELVRELRALREEQGLTLEQLAERFKISKSQASNICAYRQWKDM